MSGEQRSTLYRLIENQLGASLAAYVATRRTPLDRLPPQSWRSIAAELSERVGVEVSHEALRSWFVESEEHVA